MDKNPFDQRSSSAAPSPVQETVEALAQRGNAEAQFSLGLMYASGKGDALDYAQAEHWYLKAADRKHALAHFNLAMMYANGQGMPSDRAKSEVWIQKAADLGDAGAQYNLGAMYHRAVLDGLPEDASQSRINAYKWFRLAAAQGYRGAQVACDMVNSDMTHEDVAEGGRRVAAFKATQTDLLQAAQS
jgi:TPR repeat protein